MMKLVWKYLPQQGSLAVNFFRIFEIDLFPFVVAMSDQVHDVRPYMAYANC